MFLRIFVPLDGSKCSEQALEMATLLARCKGTSEPPLKPLVILFQAVDVSTWLWLEGEPTHAQARQAAALYLEGQAERLRKLGITVETAVRLGNPAEEILEQTMARQAEVIIMSTHGRSGLARWALGSVAERVARAAPVPVLLLPRMPAFASGDTSVRPLLSLSRILIPLDGSVTAEAALQPAITLARLLKAEVRLLYVFIPCFEEQSVLEHHRSWDVGRRRVHQIERYLMRKVDEVKREGVNARWALGYGMPAPQIMNDAREHQVGLMVMTTQGRSGLGRWRLGRVAEEVIHQGQVPVLLAAVEEKAEQPHSQIADEITTMTC
ncbi:MAG TPA: universal stress protein [Ktedonobacterales bacterium]|nr:universal stress protein [Ktedonobacterales bacterium]